MKKNFFLILFISLLFGACASINTIRNGKSEGETQLYKTTPENAWVYSLKIFRESGISIEEKNQAAGTLIGSTPAQEGSYGSYLGVWIEKADKDYVGVTVYNRRVLATQLKSGFTSDNFFAKFVRYVEAEK